MLNDIDYNHIENEALNVLDAYEITKPVVNVAEIAKGEGINIKEIKMQDQYKGVAGFYDKKSNTIYIEETDAPKRKSFTIAHELGHIFMGHQNATVLYRIPRKDARYAKEEKEANCFAADLLMPDFMLKEYMEKYHLGKSDYVVMSDMFGVPIPAMKVQLEWLK